MHILPKVNPTSALGSTLNKLINYVKSITLRTSPDIIVRSGPSGTILELADHLKNAPTDFMRYRGEFDPNLGYSKGDVVRVYHDVNYGEGDADSPVDVTPGIWVCVRGFPSLSTSNAALDNGFLEGGTLTRVDGVKYFPRWPEPETRFEDIQGSSDVFERADTVYWEFLSGMPVAVNKCENGVSTTVFVDSFPSGSVDG